MNKFILIGNLTKDPEQKMSPKGHTVINFTVADNSKNSDKQDVTTFFRCTKWGDDRFIMTYLKKGSAVMVTGALEPPRIYTDKDGSSKISMSMLVNDVQFLPGRKDPDASSGPQTHRAPADIKLSVPRPFGLAFSAPNQEDDEVPF